MGKKYFVHPSANVAMENGKVKAVCSYCHAELPLDERGMATLKTDFPCSVSVPIPFDDEVEISVWDCRARVLVNNIDISKFANEEEQEKLEELALESIEAVGGAINWSGIYPPSEKLVKYASRLARKYRAEILEEKLKEAEERIKTLEEKLERAWDAKWRMKKAVIRYMNKNERDEEFLKTLKEKKIFNILYSSREEVRRAIAEVKKLFREYYESGEENERQDFTEDANLLIEGYVICCEENTLPF